MLQIPNQQNLLNVNTYIFLGVPREFRKIASIRTDFLKNHAFVVFFLHKQYHELRVIHILVT